MARKLATTESSVVNKVLLDDISQARLIDSMGNDLSVVRAARVSYDADWRVGLAGEADSDTRLIRYLVKHHHTSPFEAVQFTFEVTAPIFVFRQWHRHRTWSYNEVSARYTELDMGFYLPQPEVVGKQSASSKQARDLDTPTETDSAVRLAKIMKGTNEVAFSTYHYLLNHGYPRELARSVLPVATYSRMFASVNMLNLWRFLQLRLHPHAQWEIRQYAAALFALAAPIAPTAFGAFYEHWLDDAMRAEVTRDDD